MEGRRRWRYIGRGHTWTVPWWCFSYFFLNWPLPWEQRHLTGHKKEGRSAGSRGPHHAQQSTGGGSDAKPSTQSPHMLLWPAVKPWYSSNLRPPLPHHQASLSPLLSLSLHASLSFTVLMTRHKLPHIQPPQSKDNHITADDVKLQLLRPSLWTHSDMDLHKSKQYNQQLKHCGSALLFPSCMKKKRERQRERGGERRVSTTLWNIEGMDR